jgi:hypothetical protein
MLPASAAAATTSIHPLVFKFFINWQSFSYTYNDFQLHIVETMPGKGSLCLKATILQYQL